MKDTAIRDLVSGIEYDGLKHNEAGWYLNGKGSWAANPWVWRIEFRRIK